MAEAKVPLYLINGFLDAGKSTLITETLNMEYFADGRRTVVLSCEEGEAEFDEEHLKSLNARLVRLNSKEDLNTTFLYEVERRFHPKRVLMEYNGMWSIDILRDLKLPKTWGLYQAISVIDATTFETYRANMQPLLIDMVVEADMVMFNRCTTDMDLSGWKRTIRGVNRMTEVVFQTEAGEELPVKEILPYNIEDASITLSDEDFSIWYIDTQENPDRYLDKTVTFTSQVLPHDDITSTQFIAGRNAMTCCADDIRFCGLVCNYDGADTLTKADWVTVTATIKKEFEKVYDSEDLVLYATSVTPATEPEDPLVYFR